MESEEGTELNLAHLVRPAPEYARGNPPEGGTPGLLLLHGRGADEYDLIGLEAALDPRLTIVSVRAPFRFGPGFAWYGMGQVGDADDDTLLTSLNEMREFLRGMVPAYGIDPQRLYLMGFSEGAVVSAALALTMPERIRGVIMHSGYVPKDGSLEPSPSGIESKPFFVAHGKYDDVIPISFGREAEEYLRSLGARLTYQEYPIGHSISEESLYDLADWLSRELDS